MALGKQFENTYWENPETGETHSWVRENDSAGIPRSKPTARLGNIENVVEQHGPLQGLLFHPLTGTGLKGDPMIPEGRREEVIRESLGLTDPEAYRQRVANKIPGQSTSKEVPRVDENGAPVLSAKTGAPLYKRVQIPKLTKRAAETHSNYITEAADETGIPTHVFEGLNTNVILDPHKGRAWAEGMGGTVRLTWPRYGSTGKKSIQVDAPAPKMDSPIFNHSFWKNLDSVIAAQNDPWIDSDWAERGALKHATHWHNPKTGHTITTEEAEKIYDDFGSRVYSGHHVQHENHPLRDYVPNLFIGPADVESKKYATKWYKNYEKGWVPKIEVGRKGGLYETGYGNERIVHTRFEIDPDNVIPATKKVTITRNPVKLEGGQQTLTHELGHVADPNLKVRNDNPALLETRADPMHEGVADAFADRFMRYKDSYEDVLSDEKNRVSDITDTGYSLGYSGWKTKTHRALYAATRMHVGLDHAGMGELPNRDAFAKLLTNQEIDNNIRDNGKGYGKQRDKYTSDFVNTMALGHIYEHMPHVHGILRQLNLEDTAKAAHQEYLRRVQGPQAEQPKLPGMEDY